MNVRSIGWLGVRTRNSAGMSAFYKDIMGLRLVKQSADGSSIFCTADGTEAHVYPANDEFHKFFGSGPVVGFFVESFSVAMDELKNAGIPLVYEDPQRNGTLAWQHFRAPDGNVYEIIGRDDLAPESVPAR
jgi:catechol 2,3-dioxygenase-like lactoylglutathione lyase family enzyme